MSEREARYKAYDELATLAGRESGMADPTPQAVAASDAARSARDGYWAEFERRLRDTQTYTLDQIVDWLRGLGCSVSRSGVARGRTTVTDRQEAFRLAAERSKAVIEAAKAADAAELLAAGETVAAQLLFEALCELPAAALADATTPQIVRMIEAVGKLRMGSATADLMQARHREVDAAKRRVDEKAKAAPDGRLSREDVYRLLDDMMRGAA